LWPLKAVCQTKKETTDAWLDDPIRITGRAWTHCLDIRKLCANFNPVCKYPLCVPISVRPSDSRGAWPDLTRSRFLAPRPRGQAANRINTSRHGREARADGLNHSKLHGPVCSNDDHQELRGPSIRSGSLGILHRLNASDTIAAMSTEQIVALLRVRHSDGVRLSRLNTRSGSSSARASTEH
jgi:hypothetical protein